MTNYDICQQFYEWGIDIKPYIGLMVTQQEYEEITKLNRGEQNGEETS